MSRNQVRLEIEDCLTGKTTLVNLDPHQAKKIYLALRELFGDIQYEAAPGELITMPDVRMKAG